MFGLKKHFLLDPRVIFLNHGSFGATPRPVFRAYQRWQRELERQPVAFLARRLPDLLDAVREALAAYLGTAPNHLALTTNVTTALNIVVASLPLGPGDEVLMTDHEYGAMERLWRFWAAERGFTLRVQPLPLPLPEDDEAIVAALWQGVTPRTRVLFFSHITSPTALVLPVAAIARRARAAGLLTVVDGAHAPGQVDLNLDALGVDFYGGNLHKWLGAPKGAGFLYAHPAVQELLKPLVVSWGYQPEWAPRYPFAALHEIWGTRDPAAWLAVPEAIRFQQAHDWARVRRACHAALTRTVAALSRLTGQPPLSRPQRYQQMAAVPLPPGVDPTALQAWLYTERRIEVPALTWQGHPLLRISVQGYNTHRDLAALRRALAAYLGRE